LSIGRYLLVFVVVLICRAVPIDRHGRPVTRFVVDLCVEDDVLHRYLTPRLDAVGNPPKQSRDRRAGVAGLSAGLRRG
jgi:hypothetical protein